VAVEVSDIGVSAPEVSMSMLARPAATVIVVRPDPEGLRVFLAKRNRAVGFMPNAWVFPGGKVDPNDRLADHPGVLAGELAIERLGGDRDAAVAILVAAVRETFEESGLWLGPRALPGSVRASLASGALTLADALRAHGGVMDLGRLVPWSWWVTPEVEPRRFDTRFLIACVADGDASHDAGETVDSAWFRPVDAMAAADAGDLAMAPPTWWTLHELSACHSFDDVLAAAAQRPQRPIQPVFSTTPDGAFELLLPGHPRHPEPPYPGLPTAVRYAQGRWWAVP
jgi:8-oxo-dGTP pyrophosphatase MutT (NUDIX family)